MSNTLEEKRMKDGSLKRCKRNSEIRRHQNRVSSRVYRMLCVSDTSFHDHQANVTLAQARNGAIDLLSWISS